MGKKHKKEEEEEQEEEQEEKETDQKLIEGDEDDEDDKKLIEGEDEEENDDEKLIEGEEEEEPKQKQKPLKKFKKEENSTEDFADKDARTLFVGRLAESVDEDMLNEAFSAFGTVEEIRFVWRDRDNKIHKGCAFVQFDSAETAKKAQIEMNGKELEGSALNVDFSKGGGKKQQQNHLLEVIIIIVIIKVMEQVYQFLLVIFLIKQLKKVYKMFLVNVVQFLELNYY